ncbi:CARDB domain-containing protein [Polluticaenibacter yanchengensis]|uniref:T9SS type A sorting domain-containing protein n=1 Tax=Polluticaenibacter yanchengensis TaxID=3014562 RepID=A0ABT4UR12_9BACT|nr:hypothetical protein [Chitinophagaceae bacterium LY-5]
MKKILYTLIFFLHCYYADAQNNTSEQEPNNSFATANATGSNPTTISGSVGDADLVDYFKPDISTSLGYWKVGSYSLILNATNTSNSPQSLTVRFFNSRQEDGKFFDSTTVLIAPGASISNQYFSACGRVLDDVYIALSASGSFDYSFSFYIGDPFNDSEPNNSVATATVLSEPLYANRDYAINFLGFDPVVYDVVDYFRINLSQANYDDAAIRIKAKNLGCNNNQWIQYEFYKNGSNTPFTGGYVGNSQNVDQWTEVVSDVSLATAGLSAGDYLVIKITSSTAFGYEFSSVDNSGPVDYDDAEDNCCNYNAIPLTDNIYKGGGIGAYEAYYDEEYDYWSYNLMDEYDTYRIDLAQPGSINLFIEALGADCPTTNMYLYYDLLDANGNEISSYNEIFNWQGNSCDHSFSNVIKIRGLSAETFYIRLHVRPDNVENSAAAALVNYKIKYQFLDGTSNIDTEYNGNSANAIPITPNQVVKGNVGFKGTENDRDDFYKANLPGVSSIRAHVKLTYRGNWEVPLNQYYANLAISGFNFRKVIPVAPANGLVKPDSVYHETFELCGLPQGPVFFDFSTDFQGIEYEFSFEELNSNPWPNDTLSGNTISTAGVLKKDIEYTGYLGYRNESNVLNQSDYYKIALNKPGNIRVHVELRNPTCTNHNAYATSLNLQAPTSSVYNKTFEVTAGLGSGQSTIQSFEFCGLGTDTLSLRLSIPFLSLGYSSPMLYKIRYEITDSASNEFMDAEPNNSFAQASIIHDGETKKGIAGYFRDIDYYKFFASADTIKIPFTVTNKACVNDYITVSAYSSTQTLIASRRIGTNIDMAPGQSINDLFKFYMVSPDTVYLLINSGSDLADAMQYSLSLNPQPPSSAFSLSGDPTVCFGNSHYKATGITDNGDLTYHWSLPDGGGSISATDSIAVVNWTNAGNRRIALYLSNPHGISETRYFDVLVNNNVPTQIPVLYQLGRKLFTQGRPPGATYQWYRNNNPVAAATDSIYLALSDGIYTVKYHNDCGSGPASDAVNFTAVAQAQTISFPAIPDIILTPGAKVKLPAVASSGLPVQYIKTSGSGYIQNDTLYISGTGTLTGNISIKAIQPGDIEWLPAAEVTQTIKVVKGSQNIHFNLIENQVFNTTPVTLNAVSNIGLPVSFTVIAGNDYAQLTGNSLTKKGVGTVTIRATQAGDANYQAATPVEHTFCIALRTLSDISGESGPCQATYQYTADKIPGANYVWTLSGGGTLTTNKDTAWVQWLSGSGTFTLSVKANSSCDADYSNEVSKNITMTTDLPAAVSNMLPVDGVQNAGLPLTLSWIPVARAVSYDVYIWDSASAQPATAFAKEVKGISLVVPQNAFAYNNAYAWRVVAKNPCASTPGVIQHFRLIPLPDLQVSNIEVPATANSGQNISLSWRINNIGPGSTLNNQHWKDAIFLSTDPQPVFSTVMTNPARWPVILSPKTPLLIGTKSNISSLASGESYTNTINFTIPVNYNGPFYAHVITDYGTVSGSSPIQLSRTNDTARAVNNMQVTLSPAPDLRVDQVFTPATVFSGSNVNITYQVKNYGALTPAMSNWSDSVFISQNPLFNREDCMPVKWAKSFGSYYPNAVNAGLTVNDTLETNASYTKSMNITIPNFIMGQWYIYVKTNANAKLYEGIATENNVGSGFVQVFLTPTPKLAIQNISLPVTNAGTTQTVGVNWEIKNQGFNDNIEKNKGHYVTLLGGCSLPCYTPIPNAICEIPSFNIRDSIGFGSSYWKDRIYLSKSSTGLDISNAILVKEVVHGEQYSGVLVEENLYATCGPVNKPVNVNTVLSPNAVFPKSASFVLPADLTEGSYYVYIYTNPDRDVFEYPGTAEIKRSDVPIAVTRPDISVTGMNVPVAGSSGQKITIAYTVNNQGQGSLFNQKRTDRLYISNFPDFDASAVMVAANQYTETIVTGSSETHYFNYTMPYATTGARYFYVVTNEDQLFKETNSVNNRSAAAGIMISPAMPADLSVSTLNIPDTLMALTSGTIIYTVTNSGTGDISGTWPDKIYVGCTNTFQQQNAILVGKKEKYRQVAAGQSYTDTLPYELPYMMHTLSSCFANGTFSDAYFYIQANADSTGYEATNFANNITASGKKTIINPYVDHIVKRIANIPEQLAVGRPIAPRWVVENLGHRPANSYYTTGWDAIYLSTDSVLSADDLKVYELKTGHNIAKGDSSVIIRSFNLPDIPAGLYYFIVQTNSKQTLWIEQQTANNYNLVRNTDGMAKKIEVVTSDLPDLTDSITFMTQSVAAGQPTVIRHMVTNIGVGETYPGYWKNTIWLSRDTEVSSDDILLSGYSRSIVLQPGSNKEDTIPVRIPVLTAPGTYYVLVRTNDDRHIIEPDYGNNTAVGIITIFTQPVSDLTVTDIEMPDTVYLGEALQPSKWTIKNIAANAATGYSVDGIYFSKSAMYDTTAILIGTVPRALNIAPVSDTVVTGAPLVTAVTEGKYFVYIKTDIQDHINESDKANNTGLLTKQVHVKVRSLVLNEAENTTLSNIDKYYKLTIPDSLIGSTISVKLSTMDSLTKVNEMYIGSGYIPSAAKFDYKFGTPNYGNQRVIITNVTNREYYIIVRCSSAQPAIQNIILMAEVMPFSILNVTNASGGNIGNVTVRIDGTLFTNSMTATLTRNGTSITASAIHYTNSTGLYATFNLAGAPLGLYDVVLTKPDNTQARLTGGFRVEVANNGGLITGSGPNKVPGNGNEPGCDPGSPSGKNSQLVIELIVPSTALLGRTVAIQINYQNPTNYDIPAQSRLLSTIDGMQLALRKEDIEKGSSSIYLDLTEPGGPPGIIRAGARGSVIIYTRTPWSAAINPIPFNLQ